MLDKALIQAALLRYAEEADGWGSFGYYTNFYNSKGKTYEIPGLGIVTVVDCQDIDSEKSYDGWTEELWVVFDVQGTLYKAEGTYTSYVGSKWFNELKVVVPKEKTVIYYEEKDSNDQAS